MILLFTGLGSNLDDICGKDFVFGGGDHGDPGKICKFSWLVTVTCVPYLTSL